MSALQKTGMSIFITASVMLISVLFLNQYQLTEQAFMSAVSSDSELKMIARDLAPMKDKTYSFNVNFNKDIEHYLQSSNKEVKSRFSLTNKDINNVLTQFSEQGIKYSTEKISGALDGSEEGKFKVQKLKDYTSWMEGREYSDLASLEEHLKNTKNNINANVINEKGYGDHKIKALKLALTRQSSFGPITENTLLWLLLTIGLGVVGALMYILPKLGLLPGIKNDHIFHSPNSGRGWIGYMVGFLLIGFYVILYWFPEYMTSWMILVDPISLVLNGNEASQWFFYGFLYTLAIGVMGIRMIIKYRHSKYQMIRTYSVIFFQVAFAFLIPEILIRLNKPSMDLKNIWPLNYTFFFDYNIENLTQTGSIGLGMLMWGIILTLIGVPIITYFYGKRWYCSWVCGCGGLAETLGDPYRQLSDKSLKAWKIERWMIHSVLVFVVVMTFGTLYTYFTGSSEIIGISTYDFRSVYGFVIGAAFAGVVGVGFYPFMGSRVWCRFGCPLAAYLGIVQRFKSRFRITTNGAQCISCGNCSTYCEMGIDVRSYAQKGQNIVRASCVGCGVCSSVCPRGVLKLENKDPKGRFGEAILIGNEGVKMKT
ncbi:4Fe-4S binding protein [Fulvivirga sp. 29W222]|uniref:4Fe-4S binding protein n=1 Tax=Fulvivirga marina TaxID=2494733 RepID=A0A937G1Z9_9BACT|nr:4Fe-4S dicluster domain-containing protein [Fulvivirga marina]MBL6447011.1 4Fe-4S binding protein [Fulvivirga marina]